MKINLEFDAAAMAAPASFRAALETAVTILDETITTDITVNINIQYNEHGIPAGSAEAGPDQGLYVSYSTVRNDLITGATPGDTSFNALPAGTSIQGHSQVVVWNAQLKAFGLMSPNDTTTDDGTADFSSSIPLNLLVGVALHELTHAMGRVPYGPSPDIFDLFRFTSPGTRYFNDGIPAQASYFSLDGGYTHLADYGQNSDPSDFLNTSLTPNDPFNEYYSWSTLQHLTTVDLQQMDALGFHVLSAPPLMDSNQISGLGPGTLYGTAGNDTLLGLNVNGDVINGEGGTDTMKGGVGNDIFQRWSVGNDTIDGGGGTNTLDYSQSPDAAQGHGMVVNLDSGKSTDFLYINDTFVNIQNFVGTSLHDAIMAGDGTEVLNGGGGTDTVGYRQTSDAAQGYGMTINLANGTATDGHNVNDTLVDIQKVIGTPSDDLFIAGGGTEVLRGAGGTNTVNFSQNPDVALGHGVTVNLAAGTASDGLNVNDTLVHIQNVIGTPLNDVITANYAANVLTGNGGNDTFVFHPGDAAGDTVTDFHSGDQLEFVGYGTAAQGATFTEVDATHWTINSADGAVHETLTLANGAPIHPGDYFFS
jgi:Ca2+-binding RTX toxin-like protein